MRYRKRAREESLIILYRWDLAGGNLNTIKEEHLEEKELSDEAKKYIDTLISTVSDNIVKIDSMIEEHLENWSFDRLGYIERSILRLGVAELIFIGVQDPGRAFNDYIDLAKKYGDEKAGKFVHGILGNIYKQRLSSEDKVKN